jgi:hypothetical protein
MRACEFIVENLESPSYSENNLIDSLESVRNRFQDTGEEPKISLRALVNMVRNLPGSEMFNVDSLKSIYEKSDTVKNLIASVKDDEGGAKTVFIKSASTAYDDPDLDINNGITGSGSDSGSADSISGPEKTVDRMAKRAASKR